MERHAHMGHPASTALAVTGAAAALVIAVAAVTASAPSAVKCPVGTPVLFADAPEPAYVLNGKLATAEELKRVDPDSIARIAIVCADELYRVMGIKAQRNGILIFTRPGPEAELKASLDALAPMQQAHLEKHGVFARDIASLPWVDVSGLITVTMTVTDDGERWSAFGTHRYLFGPYSGITVSGSRK